MSDSLPPPPQKPIPPTPPIKPIPPQKNKGQKIKKKTGTAAVVSPSAIKGNIRMNVLSQKTSLFYPSLYDGRFTREQFWSYWIRGQVFLLVIEIVLACICYVIFNLPDDRFEIICQILGVMYYLFYMLPITVKRIHDLGYSAILPISLMTVTGLVGLWAENNDMLILCLIAGIVCLFFMIWIGFFDSQEGANSYGDSTKYPDLLMRMRIALQTGTPEQMYRLIESGGVKYINTKVKEGTYLLHIAAKLGHTEIAKMLIEAGADVNKVDNARYTPLQWAAYNKHKEIVELLKQQRTASKQNYTAFLSDTYPSFAGVATKTEFRSAFWSLVTLDYLWTNFTICVKRYHAFGWSYTYCNLFPSIMLGLIGLFFFGYGFAEEDRQYLIIGSVITPILNTIYFLIIGGVCFFGNAHIDTCGNSNDDKINKYKNLPIRCAYVLLPLCVLGSVVFFELPCIKPSIQQNKAEIKLRRLGYEDSYESHRIEEKDNDDIMKLKIAARWISPSEAFHKAMSDNNVELMKFLIEKGADVNKTNEDGRIPLFSAAGYGHTEVVKLLIEAGADVNKTTEVGWTPLHTAAGNGHTEVVKLLIEAGADVNKTTEVGWTPLHRAAGYGHTEVVKLLIEAGAVDKDVNKADEDGMTLLYNAASCGRTEAVKMLIEAGADVNKADNDGYTPLYRAAASGHSEIVKLLTEAGADVNKAAEDGTTPLCAAAYKGRTEIVKLLIEAGADVNKANEDGWTPSFSAAQYGCTEIVKLLIEAGAVDKDVNKAYLFGTTRLCNAAENGHTEMVKLLIEAGADVNKADNDGETPLYRAAMRGHTEAVKLLIAAGADVNKADEDGWTPLYWAAADGHTETVKMLIEAGADVNKAAKYGTTPLYTAVYNGHIEIVKMLITAGADVFDSHLNAAKKEGNEEIVKLLVTEIENNVRFVNTVSEGNTEAVKVLIEAGADVNKADKDGETPLYVAARCGYTEIVKMLIEEGADVNKAENYGKTPLYVAALEGQTEVVKLLIEEGADVNKAHNNGATPLYAAARYGYTEIVELLKAAGAKE